MPLQNTPSVSRYLHLSASPISPSSTSTVIIHISIRACPSCCPHCCWGTDECVWESHPQRSHQRERYWFFITMTSQSQLHSVSHIRDLKTETESKWWSLPITPTCSSEVYKCFLLWDVILLLYSSLWVLYLLVNYSLSLHQTAERQWNLHPRGYGGLQEAAKPAKDVRTGLFLFFGLTAEWHLCIWEIQLRSGQRDKKSFWNIPT